MSASRNDKDSWINKVLPYLSIHYLDYNWIPYTGEDYPFLYSDLMTKEEAMQVLARIKKNEDPANHDAINLHTSRSQQGFKIRIDCCNLKINQRNRNRKEKLEDIARFLNEVHRPILNQFINRDRSESNLFWEVGSYDTPNGSKYYLCYSSGSSIYSPVHVLLQAQSASVGVAQEVFDPVYERTKTQMNTFGNLEKKAGFTSKIQQQFTDNLQSNRNKKILKLGSEYFYFEESSFTEKLFYLAEKYFEQTVKAKPLPTPPKPSPFPITRPAILASQAIPPNSSTLIDKFGAREKSPIYKRGPLSLEDNNRQTRKIP